MENLIARVATAIHATPDTARQAIAMIIDFIEREGPEEAVAALVAKTPEFQAIVASTKVGGEGLGGLAKGLMGTGAGMMGGGGLMALGASLMSLGLNMHQIQTTGKLVFEYARLRAGDDVMGEISAAIPGLSQFI
jgi:hypothetical protein